MPWTKPHNFWYPSGANGLSASMAAGPAHRGIARRSQRPNGRLRVSAGRESEKYESASVLTMADSPAGEREGSGASSRTTGRSRCDVAERSLAAWCSPSSLSMRVSLTDGTYVWPSRVPSRRDVAKYGTRSVDWATHNFLKKSINSLKN
jgi:hypothetical protein